jgi:Bacterial nucleoid DNA-binding protein
LPAVDRNTFIEGMVIHTSLTKNEAASALDYLFEALPRYISLGHSVKLGELGSFRPLLQSEGSDESDEAVPAKVIRKRVAFVFGRKFRDLINSLPVQQYPDI